MNISEKDGSPFQVRGAPLSRLKQALQLLKVLSVVFFWGGLMRKIIVTFFAAFVLTGCAGTQTQQMQQQSDGKLREQLEKANTALQEARLITPNNSC